MFDFAPTPANALFDATAHTLTNVNEALPPLGNSVLLGENLYMIFRAGKYVISAAKFTNGSIVESLPVVDLVK